MQQQAPGLGRIHVPDEQDKHYPLRAALPPRGTPRPDYRYWWSHGIEDQDGTTECVAYSGHGWALDGPVRNTKVPDQDTIYNEARKRDGIPGTDYDGTNDRGLMKFFKEIGIVAEYRWAQTMDDVLDGIAFLGPLLFGTDWYRGMFEPDERGFLVPTGPIDGGHEWEIIGVSFNYEFLTMKQTWGRGWGNNGRAKVSFEVAEFLLFDDSRPGGYPGDCCIGTEVKAA